MYKYPSAKKIKAARSYTIPEVAEVLGCTTRTVRSWAGMGGSVRQGGVISQMA